MIRVYYDNGITSGLVRGRIWPETERVALSDLEAAHQQGTIKRVTSRDSWREQERTRDEARRAELLSARGSCVGRSGLIIAFSDSSSVDGPHGTVAANPIVTDFVDEALFNDLRRLGLKEADARHFMYAAANNCQRFVTLDSDFLDRRQLLQERRPSLRVVSPSELAAELHRGVRRTG
jgi:hypothetical protein